MENEVYQELVRRASHDPDYASYVLLLNTCKNIVEAAPDSIETLNKDDKQNRLSTTMEQLMDVLTQCVPFEELIYYVPRKMVMRRRMVI